MSFTATDTVLAGDAIDECGNWPSSSSMAARCCSPSASPTAGWSTVADLLADDISACRADRLVLDCLEFDDHLRYVDGIDDAAFRDGPRISGPKGSRRVPLGARYRQLSGDNAPAALMHFYIAYRAVVRAKVDCVRVTGSTRSPSRRPAPP